MFKIQRRITPSLLARSSLSLYAGIRPPTLLTARRFQNTTEVDAHTGASVVLVDPKQAAQERDRLSRMLLTTNAAPRVGGILSNRLRQVVKLADVAHTVPYSLSFVVNSEHILDSGDLAEGQSEEEEEAVRMGKIEAYKAELTEKAKNVLKECFDMVNTHLNHFNPDSEISKLNALPVGQKHVMSAPLREVLMCVQEVYKASGNCFDASVLKLTKKLLKKANALTDADSASLIQVSKTESKRYSLPNCFEMDLENNTISRKFDDAELDLGGLNKGYTVDCVIQKLREAGIPNCLFEWGGDCKASGVNVQNSPWVVGIVRPPSVEELEKRYHDGQKDHRIVNLVTEVTPSGPSLLRVLTLNNEALCTSGDYENLTAVRTRNEAGEEVVSLYCSIYDWQDRTLLRPSDDHLAQVSVRCYSCMYADAFATASLVKKTPDRVRYMLEAYRSNYNRVTDYALYTRQGERLAHMHEIAKESRQLRDARIASALPARVIVIGGGLAGCAAAIEAAHCGAQVILLEKESKLGGNSAKATSGINGWGTRAQAENHVVDDCRFFERDTYLSGKGGHCDPGLVRTLSVKSSEAIEWLIQFGIPLTTLYQLGGHCRRRCHRVPDTADGKPVPVGYTIMSTLHRYIVNELKDKVTILYNTSVTDFIIDTKPLANGSKDVFVKGIHYKVIKSPAAAAEDAAKQRQRSPRQREEEEAKSIMSLTGDAVVLATGGFSNDRNPNSLLREYAPQLYGTPTTNGEFATGDGVKIASRYGASLVDMDKVQLHPTGLINPSDPSNRTKILGPEALRGSGGILLNQDGERFINELDLRSVVSQAILAQEHEYPNSGGSKFAYCVLGEEAAKLFGVNALHYYWKELGVFTRVETLQELADLMHCPIANLEHTLTEYQELSSAKKVCPSTGKVVYPSVLGPKGPFYVAYVTPLDSLHDGWLPHLPVGGDFDGSHPHGVIRG
ncbi:ApbE family/Alanine dehydrogenase/PNT, C-terminal domain/FAD dependent oxidoreductase/Pyridine nucleotide-disulphide oxidoreductase/Glucose inhibited division protein A/FAD binding domain/NAD(P)-binding Rossmann-like domain containing protein, putative [Angomonas deanei]|uniref:fumarate reductase (NADH) n=1 Tax=Angomonas deanei TaxID=59799 RepID=A0A7G2C768_9TRYP|nr:ApbE family/Alanine dehydrogenase/PNT, C-terminal domain/FAD dependent oxidoreductase/Pyridine nucleotide-disulphide oxidoreductase/Glucose inhibited division protein A/FAD binding domain/NAD(P)-binding Rossmann-like domain containing protein, putative [Angomonas deanei]